MSRVFLTVLDAVGAGEAPDAAEYGDAGTNTLGHVIAACHPDLPNMAAMGLWQGPGGEPGKSAWERIPPPDTGRSPGSG